MRSNTIGKKMVIAVRFTNLLSFEYFQSMQSINPNTYE